MQRATLVTHVDISKPTAEEVAAANQTLPGDVLLTETDASARLSEIAVNGSMATDGPVKDTDVSSIDPNTNVMTAMEGEQTANSSNESSRNSVAKPNQTVTASGAVQTPSTTATVTVPVQNTASAQTQVTANASATNVTSPTTNAQTMPAVAGQSTLNIQLTGDCWINIVDANGKAIVDGVRGAGANIQASGVLPFKVILGAPTVVSSFTVDGKAISLAEFPKGRVARLTIPQA